MAAFILETPFSFARMVSSHCSCAEIAGGEHSACAPTPMGLGAGGSSRCGWEAPTKVKAGSQHGEPAVITSSRMSDLVRARRYALLEASISIARGNRMLF